MELRQLLLASVALLATTASIYMIMNAPSNNRKYLKAFINHKNRFGKTHANQEELSYRYAIYASNMEFIEAHNKKGKTFTCGENQFTDMTFTEFKSKYLSSVPVQHTLKRENVGEIVKGGVDWVAQGKVSDVKNQKACGSCWAFSTTGSMESAYRIFKNEDLEFSEQELVDCSGSYGNMGCNGGIMSAAFDYIQDSELTTEDYRYTARRGSCKSKRYTNRYGINGYEQISPIDVSGLMSALDQQPVSVAIEVQEDFMHYSGGVYASDDEDCGQALNHGVLAVGYSTDDDFIKVKNSWSEMWGEEGYIRMKIGSGSGTCGIANPAAVYPNVN